MNVIRQTPGDDFSLSRLREALAFFLLFFLAVSVFLTVFLLLARHQLAGEEADRTAELLSLYLERGHAAPLQLVPDLSAEHERLGGLSFLRITRSSNRLLLAGDDISAELFQKLLHLEPLPDGSWLKLPADGGQTLWSVASRRLANGVLVQAGRESGASYRRFRQLVQLNLVAGGLGLLLSLAAAFFAVRRMAAPLVRLRMELEQLMAGGRQQLLDDAEGETDRGRLYRQVNRLIRQNRRLVSEMQASLDNVAHDLRTPMTRLRSVAEFGLREDSDIHKLRESLADCLEESERVLAMLRIMMSVAEAETGTIRLERERLDLAESIGEMVELYEYVAEERRITLTTDFAPKLVCLADRTRIAQVWANLLDNAIKYGREGGFVQVRTSVAGDRLCIHFRDNGMGISATEQPRIWERLYRGDRSRSRQGLGLGLNFVRAIVEAHGGTVEVESALYEGSCFTVYLPEIQEPAVAGSMEKSQTSGEWSERRTSGI